MWNGMFDIACRSKSLKLQWYIIYMNSNTVARFNDLAAIFVSKGGESIEESMKVKKR